MSRSEWKEPHRVALQENIPRSVPILLEERRPPAELLARTSVSFSANSFLLDFLKSHLQREAPRRPVDTSRPPPTAPMPKLSGTNSMPIGGRANRFGGSASISPHPPAPLSPPVTSASTRGNHASADEQPVSRSVRPVSSARESHERPVCCT
jgi:hypothetical protein